MADIKPDMAAEKSLSLNEKPLVGAESLIEKPGRGVESEKIKNLEQVRKMVINEITQAENMAPTTIGPIGGVVVPQAKRQKQIENVLARGLREIYLNLTPEKRQAFKLAGEETARKINQLLAKTKVKIGVIIKLIKKWLSLIPGVNKYFLEQEAKIKADEIIKMKQA